MRGNGPGEFVAPDVIGGRFAGWESGDVDPGQVYVPATVTDTDVEFELRRTADGRLALPVYSTLEDLKHFCGPEQPWVGIAVDRVDECVGLCGADVVVWDARMPVAS